jgi:hypothetical protein
MVSLPSLDRVAVVVLGVPVLAVLGLVALDARGLFERPTLLRASFTVFGSLFALVAYFASQRRPAVSRRISPGILTKIVLALAGGAVVATAELGSRLLPFAVVLPVGFALVALQLRAEPSVPAVVTQLSALFLASRLGKYLTTGFYFGGSDTFAHVAAVDTLIRNGYTTSIAHGYDYYPVFHFVVGAVKHATGLPTYDALVLTGTVLFTLVVPLSYLVGTAVFGSTRLGLCAALGVTMLEFAAYHAVYFYPQALAIVLLFVLVYLNRRLVDIETERTYRRYSVFVLLLLGTMVFTHHLTYILFAVALTVTIPVALTRRVVFTGPTRSLFRYRLLFPGFVGAVLLLTYWAYSPSIILVGIVQLTFGLLFDLVEIPSAQLYGYGASLPADSVSRALEWLSTPTGLYATGLGALLLLAAYELLDRIEEYRRGFTLAVSGLLLSGLLLPLPVPIPQLERLKSVLLLLAVFPLAIGLHRLLSVERRYVAVAVVLVATMGGATAFTVLAADDMEAVYTDEPREQVGMTEGEFGGVGTTGAFLSTRATGTVATDRITNRAFETAQYNATGTLRAGPDGLQTDAAYLVARDRWTEHVVTLGRGVRASNQNAFVLSERRFAAGDALTNKVYSTGDVQVYYRVDGFDGFYGESARNSTLRNR